MLDEDLQKSATVLKELLGPFALGDVLRSAGHIGWSILSVILQFAATTDKTDRAVGQDTPKLQIAGLFSCRTGSDPCLHRRPVVRMNQAENRLHGRGKSAR